MLRIPALPKCPQLGDHSLIRIVKLNHSFKWTCLACGRVYTVYRVPHTAWPNATRDMIYERTAPDAEGKYIETRMP